MNPSISDTEIGPVASEVSYSKDLHPSRQPSPSVTSINKSKPRSQKSRNRSSTGCLTCRKRKKKCDETLYPVCNNCQKKELECTWPSKVDRIQKQLGQVRYYGEEDQEPPKYPKLEPMESFILDTIPLDSDSVNSLALGSVNPLDLDQKPPNSAPEFHLEPQLEKTSSYLKRIALQQDCVDE